MRHSESFRGNTEEQVKNSHSHPYATRILVCGDGTGYCSSRVVYDILKSFGYRGKISQII